MYVLAGAAQVLRGSLTLGDSWETVGRISGLSPLASHTWSCIFSYRQAQAAVLAVLPRLHQLKVPTKRPTDYFAEMAKTDQQMQKVRNKEGVLGNWGFVLKCTQLAYFI